jgi:glucose/mannose-6-phosphate isomerase
MQVDLHDRAAVTALDPHGMLRLTEQFPKQCREALAIAESSKLPDLVNRPSMVVLTGLGGSAAGGDFVRALFEAQGSTPFVVNRDYHLPNFLGLGDLVFCCSYSGNTEETLSAYHDAKKAGAKIVAITSGGKLSELAQADGHAVVTVPGGQPPRTALGFMLIPAISVAERLKLIPQQPFEAAFSLLENCAKQWTVEGPDEAPKKLATALHGTLALIYGLGIWQGLIANRWKSQINENAKVLAFPNTFPELNHNEILGWAGADKQGVAKYSVIALQNGKETEKMKARLRVTRDLIGSKASFHEVTALGESLLEQMLSLTFYGDFVSLYLAALNQVDPENIDGINILKNELAKVD